MQLTGWAMFLAASLAAGGCNHQPEFPVSPHFDGQKFHNAPRSAHPSAWRVTRHILWGRSKDWPEERKTAVDDDCGEVTSKDEIKLVFINHSTFLIQHAGLNILTDPVWSDRVGPVSWAGPKRATDPGISFGALPPIDVVLLSHNHYDHLDLPTLKALEKQSRPQFFAPLGDRKLLTDAGLTHVHTLDWWEAHEVGPLTIHFTPARHNSGRGLSDSNKSLWGSYFLRSASGSIYFAGDTAHGGHFKEIHDRLGPPAVALLPIGAYLPRDFTQEFHMDPGEAVEAHHDLGAKMSLGMHFGTFRLTAEGYSDPEHKLKALADELPGQPFRTIEEGSSVIVRQDQTTKEIKGQCNW